MSFKSYLTFTKEQRNGILLLLFLIVSLLIINIYISFSKEDKLNVSSEEILEIQNELDSLRLVDLQEKSPKRYSFNPNYLNDFTASNLGMSNEEIDRLLEFRKNENWINSSAQFQEVTGISDSLLNEISLYFKFPEWVNTSSSISRPVATSEISEKSFEQKIDLNLATQEQLQEIRGIGEVLSKRIVDYRNRIGGFTVDDQLHHVFGLDSAVVNRIQNSFTVKSPKIIRKININTASASDIATIPGISFEFAKEIWEFRRLRERIDSWEELLKIEGMSLTKLQLIQLYLSFE